MQRRCSKWTGAVIAALEMFQAAHFAMDPRGLRVDGRVHNVRYFSSSLSKVLQKLFRLPTDLLGLLPARSHAYAVL